MALATKRWTNGRFDEEEKLEHPRRLGYPDREIEFTGVAYVSGVITTGLKADSTKPWVSCNLSTGEADEREGPPSNPFPANEEWYEKANTYGDIHVVRA